MKKQKVSILPSVCRFLAGILRILTGILIILILVIMPFYFQEGYGHIGSDKSYFFRTATVRLGKRILPVFLLWLICSVVASFRKRHKGMLREWWKTLSVTDLFAFFYGVSAIFSYICSPYQGTALWGTRGWYMGLIPQMTFVAIYFLISRFQFPAVAKRMLVLGLPASAVVFLLGCLNRINIWPIPMAYSGKREFISTIGNINWYCGYAVAIGFVGVGLLWLNQEEKGWHTTLLCAYVFLFFTTLISQGSDSGIFALAIVFLTMFFLSVKDGEGQRLKCFWLLVFLLAGAGLLIMAQQLLLPNRMSYASWLSDLLTYSSFPVILMPMAYIGILCRRFEEPQSDDVSPKAADIYWRVMRATAKILYVGIPVAAVALVLMMTVNTLRPGSLGPLSELSVFTFDFRWGNFRGTAWRIGVGCFWEQDWLHKLLGVGPDCMSDFLYSAGGRGGASEALVAYSQLAYENQRLTNAHCELLTVLVNMGFVGMFTFGGMLLSAIVRFLRVRGRSRFAVACGLCVLAYAANNMWSFQQSMNLATIGVILGMGEWFLRGEKERESILSGD